jgi:hypothetical protein
MLPVVAGLFLMGAMIHGPNGMHRIFLGKLVVSLTIAGPIMLALYALARWAWRKQWWPLGAWLGVGPLLALLTIGVLLAGFYPKHEDPLEPGEHWSWEGWYWVLVYGYFGSAWLLTLFMPLWWFGAFIRQRMRGASREVAPQ